MKSNTPGFFSSRENIKRQAYLVLEENKVLQEQLDLQTNRLTDVQKAQIQESKQYLCNKEIKSSISFLYLISFEFNTTFNDC
jgi:hypothetical protein